MSSLPKILLVLALVSLACSRVFLKFDQFEESVDLYKFFYDLQEGYYVDIGAFDPMVYSNSLWMYSRGWAGINVEANPVRFNRIHYGKRRDLNLNFAIAQNLTYTTLYDIVGTEAMSTINSEVKDTLINKNYKVSKTDVPTMTMKELCHRYYLRKPNYMNLDIEGFSTFALLGNDWTDPKCMPEIITIEVNHSFNDSKIQSPQSILKSHGYRYHSTRGLSQFWIQGAAYQKFIQKYEKGTVAMKGLPVAPVEWSISSLYKHLGFKPKGEGDQIDVLNEPFYYYFPKQNSKIYLEEINRESNLYCNGTDKPILMINFNHQNTAYVVNKSRTTITRFEAFEFVFYNLTITKEDGKKFTVYSPFIEITVQYLEEPGNSSPQPEKKTSETTATPHSDQKTIAAINQLNQKIESSLKTNFDKFDGTFTGVKSNIDQVNKKIEDSQRERTQQNNKFKAAIDQLKNKIDSVQKSVAKSILDNEKSSNGNQDDKKKQMKELLRQINEIKSGIQILNKPEEKPDNSGIIFATAAWTFIACTIISSLIFLIFINKKLKSNNSRSKDSTFSGMDINRQKSSSVM